MNITRHDDAPSMPGPAETFTGEVEVSGLVQALEPGRTGAATVTFQPGARTAWHSHPFGQLLVVIEGEGWIQAEGGPKETIRAGDTVVAEPGETHWHGATDTSPMTHVAIQEARDGSPVTWKEHVDDQTYLA